MNNKIKLISSSFVFLLALIITIQVSVKAQTKYHGQNLGIILNGTSNLHNWEMQSGKASCDAFITLTKNKINLVL